MRFHLSRSARAPNIANDIGMCCEAGAAEVGEIREVQQETRRSVGGPGKNRRAAVVREENLALGILGAQALLGERQDLTLVF